MPLDDAARARIDLRAGARSPSPRTAATRRCRCSWRRRRRLEPLDARLARDTYLDALSAALFAGRLASGPGARHVAEAVRRHAAAERRRARSTLLLEALAVLFTDGYARRGADARTARSRPSPARS